MNIAVKKATLSPSRWHPDCSVSINDKVAFTLSTNYSGCGSMTLSGWANNVSQKDFSNAIIELLENTRKRNFIRSGGDYGGKLDIGLITTTAGGSYYKGNIHPNLRILIDLGFKEVSEYNNPRHGANAKQKLFIWTID